MGQDQVEVAVLATKVDALTRSYDKLEKLLSDILTLVQKSALTEAEKLQDRKQVESLQAAQVEVRNQITELDGKIAAMKSEHQAARESLLQDELQKARGAEEKRKQQEEAEQERKSAAFLAVLWELIRIILVTAVTIAGLKFFNIKLPL